MQNMNQLMKQAKQMQEKMLKAQEALGEMTVEGTSGGGAVKVVMTGHKQVESVTLDKDVVNPEDIDLLQDLLVAAFADATAKADDLANNELGKYTRGMNIPGLF